MKFYLKSSDAWAAMAQACEHATTCIDFEQYIVRDDEVGQRFLGLLARKAHEGVTVRIVLDAFGSRTLLNSQVLEDTRKSGARVIFYHMQKPRRFVRIGGLFPRTHAKLLHVDDSATYLGSMCMAEYMRHWRDTMVALDGPAAIAARRDFDVLWRDLGDGQLDGDPGIIGGNRGGVYLAQNPKGGQRPLYEALLAAIMTARHSICLATPYFFPPKRLRRVLKAAQARGVRISLLLSQQTDVAIADLITYALLGRWRRLDYDVRLYQPTVLHAKYAVIDDDWATLGSCNFDHLSLILNRECNLVMRDPEDVLGDFNTLNGLRELDSLLSGGRLRLLNRRHEPTFTFHQWQHTLDLCLYTPGLEARLDLKIIPQPFSDHARLLVSVDTQD